MPFFNIFFNFCAINQIIFINVNMKKDTVINLEPEAETISFFELLKLKVANQNTNLSQIFSYVSIFLSCFNILVLNFSFSILGMQSKLLAQTLDNFWITLILLLPFLFLSVLSIIFCFLSRTRKKLFSGLLSFYLCIFNLFVFIFFWIFISAVF